MKIIQTFYFSGLDNKEKAKEIETVIENKTRVDKAVIDTEKGTVKITIGEEFEKLTKDFENMSLTELIEDILKKAGIRQESNCRKAPG